MEAEQHSAGHLVAAEVVNGIGKVNVAVIEMFLVQPQAAVLGHFVFVSSARQEAVDSRTGVRPKRRHPGFNRHSRESGNPALDGSLRSEPGNWVPAFAGMTKGA